MQAGTTAHALVRRQLLTLESLRILVNIEIDVHTECHGVRIRRIFVTEPDAFGCNWQIEWPTVHGAIAEPCCSQLRALIEQIRERYNVAR
jgi:hypothetical protein